MSFSCAVCQEAVTQHPEGPSTPGTVRPEAEIVALRCGHVFHKMCIETWFNNPNGGECAVCKKPVTSSRIIRLYPSGTEEGDNMDKLRQQNQELAEKVGILETLKTKAETDLAKTKDEAELKESLLAISQMDLAYNKSLLAICLMELEATKNLNPMDDVDDYDNAIINLTNM